MTLLHADVLVMDQVTSFMSNDFAIRDQAGAQVGEIRTEGSALSRMFLGSRKLSVHDTDGSVLVRLDDVMTMGRDRFTLQDGQGYEIGQLVKEFTFFRKRLTLQLVNGEGLDVQGQLFDYDFEIAGPGGSVARVSRQWPGLAAGLLGRNRYVVSFNSGVPVTLRVAVDGAVVALDLIRAKEENSSGG